MMDFCYINKGIFKYRETLGLSIYLPPGPPFGFLDENKVSSVDVDWRDKLLLVRWKDFSELFESSYRLEDCRLAGPDGIFDIFNDIQLDYLTKQLSELPF